MKIQIFVAILLFALGMAVFQLQQKIVSDYKFEKDYTFAWNLADKSSTIEAKADYVSQFVGLLESNKTDFAKNNAQWLTTPDNSFEKNLEALKTLNFRLHDIMKMDMKSFEYQTAIQQITAQEQGEAHRLIGVIQGCWLKENYPMVWLWYGGIWFGAWIVLGVFAFVGMIIELN